MDSAKARALLRPARIDPGGQQTGNIFRLLEAPGGIAPCLGHGLRRAGSCFPGAPEPRRGLNEPNYVYTIHPIPL
jgi:hypothetical protein